MARLTLSYSDVYQKVGEFLGLVPSGTAPTGQDLTDVKDIVARGLRQFLYPIDMKNGTPHYWSFLNQYFTLNLMADQWKYALPLDYSDLLSEIVFDTGKWLPKIQRRSGIQIKDLRSSSDASGWPQYYAIVPSTYDLTTGSSFELWFYPKPSQSYILSTFYRIDPLRPSATTDLMVGGISAAEAILESCLGVAEHNQDDNTTQHHQKKAEELIQKLIRFDSGRVESNLVGNLYYNKIWAGLDRESGVFNTDIDFDRDVYA